MTAAPYVCMDWRHVRELFEAGANRLRRTEKHLRLGEDHARTGQLLRCPFRKSYPDVLVVQPGRDRDGDNDTGPLDRPTQGRILAQRQVRAHLIVIGRIQGKNLPQVRLTEDQHSVQALAAHGADQAFRIAILPLLQQESSAWGGAMLWRRHVRAHRNKWIVRRHGTAARRGSFGWDDGGVSFGAAIGG